MTARKAGIDYKAWSNAANAFVIILLFAQVLMTKRQAMKISQSFGLNKRESAKLYRLMNQK